MYDKYKKVKSDKSVGRVARYINDEEKTIYSISNAINYISNEAKTYEKERQIRLVTGYNCDADTAVNEFEIVRNSYYSVKNEHLNKGQTPIQAYHIISSFKGKVDPQLAHKIGLEFCQVLLGNSFQAVVSTHINTQNTHNHILINAYAMDGAYKFKDEFHLYKKLQSISNSLSLKYGIAIQMGDEKTKDTYNHSKSWAELLDKDNFQAQKEKFKQDLDASILFATDYPSLIKNMTEKGYICSQNKNSTTFKDPVSDISFRDTTLGSKYTKAALIKRWDAEKQRLEKQEAYEKLKEIRKQNAEKYKKYNIIIPRKWDEFGNRLGFLKRLLLAIKHLITEVSDDFYSEDLEKMYPKNINFQLPKKKLERIEKAIQYLDEHQIKTDKGLDMAIREAGQRVSVAKQDLSTAQSYLSNTEPIIKNLDRLEQIENMINTLQIPLDSIPLSVPTKEEIRKNRTALQPMTPKTKSRLYQKMHDSEYRLSVPFNQISNSEAKGILDFLSQNESSSRPSILLTKEEYYSQLAQNDLKLLLKDYPAIQTLPPIKPCYKREYRVGESQFRLLCMIKKAFPEHFTYNPSFVSMADSFKIEAYAAHLIQSQDVSLSFNPIPISSYSADIQDLLKEYRILKSEALSYGLFTQNDISDFRSFYQNQQNELAALQAEMQSATDEFKNIKFVQRTVQDSQKTSFVYGAAYSGKGKELTNTKLSLGTQDLDHLFEIHKNIVNVVENLDLSKLSSAPISSPDFVPPTPKIKLLLYDIKSLFPDDYAFVNVDIISEYEAVSIIKQLLEQHKLELKIQEEAKEEEKENNTERERT